MIRKYECTLANAWKGEDPRLNQKCTRCSKGRLATPRNSTRFDGIYLKKKWMIKTKYRWFQRKTSNNSSYTCGTKGLKKRRARGLKIRRIEFGQQRVVKAISIEAGYTAAILSSRIFANAIQIHLPLSPARERELDFRIIECGSWKRRMPPLLAWLSPRD